MPKKNYKKDEKVEITVRFIQQVRENEFGEIGISGNNISPRLDEPAVYSEEMEESTLLSFCN